MASPGLRPKTFLGLLSVLILATAASAAASEEEEEEGPCCPKESWGELGKDAEYEEVGAVVRNVRGSGLDLYVVGNGTRCIIWNYDIFGFDSGRTRQLADLFASKGYLVIIPDYYRGTFKDPKTGGVREFIREQTQWEGALRDDWERRVLPYAREMGSVAFGAVGTCWGSYMVVRLSAYPEVKAGVSMHPSHSPIMRILGEDERQVLSEIHQDSKQLFMPSGGDDTNVKPGGLGSVVLGDRLRISEFSNMVHGWTTRGDLDDEAVRAEVARAMEEAVAFFDRNLK